MEKDENTKEAIAKIVRDRGALMRPALDRSRRRDARRA
jgi:hypothetical protein